MGGSYPGPEKMASVLAALETNLPGAVRSMMSVQPEVAKVQAETDAAVSPIYAKSNLDLYKEYAPQMAKVATDVERQAQRDSSATEVGIAKDYGDELVGLADRFQRTLDPEYYKTRAAVGDANAKLLSSVDPTRLTGSEVAELESSIARQGGFANPKDTMGVVSNALKFGKRGDEKKQNFANLVATTAGNMPALRSGISGFEVATRRALTPNTGEGRVPTTAMNTGQNAWNTGNNMMQQATSLQAIKAQNSKGLLDQLQQGAQIGSGMTSAISSML
jgi:hypothetical protein